MIQVHAALMVAAFLLFYDCYFKHEAEAGSKWSSSDQMQTWRVSKLARWPFTYPTGMEGWVDLGGWLYAERWPTCPQSPIQVVTIWQWPDHELNHDLLMVYPTHGAPYHDATKPHASWRINTTLTTHSYLYIRCDIDMRMSGRWRRERRQHRWRSG